MSSEKCAPYKSKILKELEMKNEQLQKLKTIIKGLEQEKSLLKRKLDEIQLKPRAGKHSQDTNNCKAFGVYWKCISPFRSRCS